MGENVVVLEIKPGHIPPPRDAIWTFLSSRQMHAKRVLWNCNIKDARTIHPCKPERRHEFEIALKARTLNPNIQVVIRIFDKDFAHALQEQFGFIALSATKMAAPVFAAAAAGADVTNPISIEGRPPGLDKLPSRPIQFSPRKPWATLKTTTT